MKNKKISIIVKYFYPVTAGIETNIAETYSVLTKKGWNIDIHTSKDTLTEKNVLPNKDIIQDLNVKRYPFSKFGYWPKINWAQTDLICLHNFDIFPHFQILVYLMIRKWFKIKTGKIVLTPHGGFTPEWSTFSFIQRTIKKTYHKTLGAWLINNTVDVTRAVSEWERDEIIKYGVKKELVVMIPNGVENEAYKNLEKLASTDIKRKVKSFRNYIIQIGRIYKIKNYETTIRALAKTPKNLKYVIAGPIQKDKTYQQFLEKLIDKLALTNRVIFLGVVKGVDKYYLIKHAQMMVHMALWESFCNVVHEGLSQGLVCIVANNTALPYLIKNGINGYCLETTNENKVAEKINFVLKNKNSKFIIDMEKRNRKYGLENSWENVAYKINDLYKNLLENNL